MDWDANKFKAISAHIQQISLLYKPATLLADGNIHFEYSVCISFVLFPDLSLCVQNVLNTEICWL